MMIRERKGFTLIELIAVVFVIAILVGLSLGKYEKATERAMDEEAKTALRLIQAAQNIYKQKYGVYYESNNETDINTNLGLYLVLGNWDYETSLGPTVGKAYRQSTTRSRTLVIDSTGQPRCTSGWCDY
jgi:prepilin-type N-terminal cleavage/methylation domain-containing protein